MFHAKYQCIPATSSREEDFNKKFPYWAPKGASPFILTNLNPRPQSCFPPSLVEIGQAVLEKKSFKEKVTDGRQTNCDGNSSL